MDEEAQKAEKLTYDPKVHGTDGELSALDRLHTLRTGLLLPNAGPIVLAYPNLRPGWDTIFADTVEKLGIPFIPEGVRRLSPSRAYGDFHD